MTPAHVGLLDETLRATGFDWHSAPQLHALVEQLAALPCRPTSASARVSRNAARISARRRSLAADVARARLRRRSGRRHGAWQNRAAARARRDRTSARAAERAGAHRCPDQRAAQLARGDRALHAAAASLVLTGSARRSFRADRWHRRRADDVRVAATRHRRAAAARMVDRGARRSAGGQESAIKGAHYARRCAPTSTSAYRNANREPPRRAVVDFHVRRPGALGRSRGVYAPFRTPIEKRGDRARRRFWPRGFGPSCCAARKGVEPICRRKPRSCRIELDGAQRDLYETIRMAMHERVREEVAGAGSRAVASSYSTRC